MVAFHVHLQRFWTVWSLVTEYTLICDAWLFIPPTPQNVSNSQGPCIRKRLIAALKTSIVYAIAEPLCCFLMSYASEGWELPILQVAGLLHQGAVIACLHMLASLIKKWVKEHEEICVPREQEQGQSGVPEPNDEGESAHEGLLNKEYESSESWNAARSEQGQTYTDNDDGEASSGNSTPLSQKAHYYEHKATWLSSLAIPLPAFTAAFTNAALVLFTRLLSTPFGQEQLAENKAGFKWFAISAACNIISAKLQNGHMHTIRNHRWEMPGWRTAGTIGLCFVGIMAVRTAMRAILGLDLFAVLHKQGQEYVL